MQIGPQLAPLVGPSPEDAIITLPFGLSETRLPGGSIVAIHRSADNWAELVASSEKVYCDGVQVDYPKRLPNGAVLLTELDVAMLIYADALQARAEVATWCALRDPRTGAFCAQYVEDFATRKARSISSLAMVRPYTTTSMVPAHLLVSAISEATGPDDCVGVHGERVVVLSRKSPSELVQILRRIAGIRGFVLPMNADLRQALAEDRKLPEPTTLELLV